MAGSDEYEMNGIPRSPSKEAVRLRLEAEERRARAEKEHFLRKRDPWHQDCVMFGDADIPAKYDG